jgi:hypothetical protein
MATAFQSNAFQDSAFQIEKVRPPATQTICDVGVSVSMGSVNTTLSCH